MAGRAIAGAPEGGLAKAGHVTTTRATTDRFQTLTPILVPGSSFRIRNAITEDCNG